MKKNMMVLVVLAAMMLSAFSGSYSAVIGATADNAAEDTAPTPDSTAPAGGPKEDGERQVSEQERFIIGVFKLEGSDLAVTANQAASLVPLWTSMKEYSHQPMQNMQEMQGTPAATPDATVQPVEPVDNSEDVTALFAQIEAVMTADQLQAIADLDLEQGAIYTFMEEQGIEMPEGMQVGQGSHPGQDGQALVQGTPSGENMAAPQGTPPAGNSGNGGTGGPNGQGGQLAGIGRSGQVASSNLIDALITLLETKNS
jgi:hypothetical protein